MATDRKPDTPYRRHTAELDAGAHMHAVPLAAAGHMILAGTLVAAVFGSDILFTWAFNLPLWLGPVREVAVDAARGWHDLMQTTGLADLHPALREAFQEFQFL